MPVAKVSLEPPRAVILHPLRGFGAQFNTNLFTRDGESRPLDAAELRLLRSRIRPLRLGHSRIFVRPVTRKPGPQRVALMKTIALAQSAGANVNLTWWKGPFPHAPQDDHEAKRRKLMTDFAGIIRQARAAGNDCVTHVTVMNEVNFYDIARARVPRRSMELYEALYRDLDAALAAIPDPKDRDRTLRESIDLVGGDLVAEGPKTVIVDGQAHPYAPSDQDDWLAFMEERMADVLDAYSIHVYWQPAEPEFPTRHERRLDRLARLGIEKPIYVTEYGVRRLDARPRPGTIDGTPDGEKIEQSLEAAFQHAWFNALAPQHGCVGLSKWVLYKTSRRGEFGEWGMIAPRGGAAPFREWPACTVTRLFNQLLGPEWTAAGLGRSSGRNQLASAFRGPEGEHSVAVLNRAARSQQVQVERLDAGTTYFGLVWNRDAEGSVHRLRQVVPDAGGLATVHVPRHGVVFLSTRPMPK